MVPSQLVLHYALPDNEPSQPGSLQLILTQKSGFTVRAEITTAPTVIS